MDTKDYVTISLASIGAVLGVLNTWGAIRRDKVRIKVRPVWARMATGNHATTIGIEVINNSYFPVMISEVGYIERGALLKRNCPRSVLLTCGFTGKVLPQRIEPRDSMSFFLSSDASFPFVMGHRSIRCGFARLGNGDYYYGHSKMVKDLHDLNKNAPIA